jgi:NAD(P)H-flavin reductase
MSDQSTCENPLVPTIVKVVNIIEETYDVKTFYATTDNGIPFKVKSGQLCMVSLLPVGEGMFSVSYQAEDHLEFSIRRVGLLTDALHEIEVGQELGVRGPYGNGFPTEKCKGHNMLFIGGGIGLAPLRSFIKYCLNNRKEYGKIQVLYGARSAADLCFKKELFEEWPAQPDTEVFTTIDRPEEGWDGKVAFVPAYLEEINPDPNNTMAVVCGPPIMITMVLKSMAKLGFKDEQVLTTLEGRMKCGIGKCGRCNIGSEYICLDGPCFSLTHLRELPPEW